MNVSICYIVDRNAKYTFQIGTRLKMEMRRKDRELTAREDFERILHANKVCRVAMTKDNIPYVVPMNFGYEWDGDRLILYFHCATEGKKIEFLTANNRVSFVIDGDHALIQAGKACDYGYRFASIMGEGFASFPEDEKTKTHALDKIMEHQTGKSGFTYSENILHRTKILQITSSAITAKKKA